MRDWLEPSLEMPNLFCTGEDGVGGPPNQAGGDFKLCCDDELVGARNARRAPAQELCGTKSRDHGELEPGHPWWVMHDEPSQSALVRAVATAAAEAQKS
jgi:hypothetical protein